MREHVVTDHLGRKAEHVRKTNRTVLRVVVGALFLLLCGSFLRPLAFLVAVPALIWGAYVNQGSETWSSGRRGEMLFRQTLGGLELSDSWAAWYGVPVGRNKDGEIIDTDCILLGPGGLFVFEVKHVRHEVARLTVDLWEARESTLYSAIGSLPVHAKAATPWCEAHRDSVAPLRSAEQTARDVQWPPVSGGRGARLEWYG